MNNYIKMQRLLFKRLHTDAVLPKRGSIDAAGYDLSSVESVTIDSWSKCIIPTGWAVAIPKGYYGRVASRSGLAAKYNLEVGAGVIDSDYRGQVNVILRNLSDKPFDINVGDRIAQLVIEAIITPEALEVEDLDNTQRGTCGFGSTGISSVEPETKLVDNVKLPLDDMVVKIVDNIVLKCVSCGEVYPDVPFDSQMHLVKCIKCNTSMWLSMKKV